MALLVVAVAFIAFEGSLAVTIRAIAASRRESDAANLAELQRERAFAVACASASGSDSVNGVVVAWSATPAASLVHLTQSSSYDSRFGRRTETYSAIGRCY
jgi:hypothetical protein